MQRLQVSTASLALGVYFVVLAHQLGPFYDTVGRWAVPVLILRQYCGSHARLSHAVAAHSYGARHAAFLPGRACPTPGHNTDLQGVCPCRGVHRNPEWFWFWVPGKPTARGHKQTCHPTLGQIRVQARLGTRLRVLEVNPFEDYPDIDLAVLRVSRFQGTVLSIYPGVAEVGEPVVGVVTDAGEHLKKRSPVSLPARCGNRFRQQRRSNHQPLGAGCCCRTGNAPTERNGKVRHSLRCAQAAAGCLWHPVHHHPSAGSDSNRPLCSPGAIGAGAAAAHCRAR